MLSLYRKRIHSFARLHAHTFHGLYEFNRNQHSMRTIDECHKKRRMNRDCDTNSNTHSNRQIKEKEFRECIFADESIEMHLLENYFCKSLKNVHVST